MTIALLAQAKGNGNGTYSTGALDSTGASLLVVVFTDNGTQPAISDSKGNTWFVAKRQSVGRGETIAYAWGSGLVVGTGHTFTFTLAAQFGSGQAWAFSGVETASDPLDQTNGGGNAFTTTQATGSVTPTADGELLISGLGFDNQAALPTVNGGFSTPYGDIGSGGAYLGSASAYLIQSTAAAANPTWTIVTNNQTNAPIATFKATSTPPPPAAPPVSRGRPIRSPLRLG